MRLKSLTLQNIRSYTDHSIDFRDGISLFEGDIGSGKSSILNAIEFALFGLGNLSGAHLLRVGETRGGVELSLEVNERDYIFGRSLSRRSGKVSQDGCYIVEDGVQTHYNATDMKRRALQILNFREPLSPRSHSVIYRFAIFTPQEQMKEVVNQRPDKRKETLRKAFGIEEYDVAVSNADLIRRGLLSEIRILKTSEQEIVGINVKMEEEERNRVEAEGKITEAKKELDDVQIKIVAVIDKIEEKEGEEKVLRELSTKIELLNQEKSQLLKELKEISDKLVEYTEKLEEIEEAERTCKELESGYSEFNKLKKEIQGLEPKQYDYNENIHQKELIESRIASERKNLEDRLNSVNNRVESINSRMNSLKKAVKEITPLTKSAEKLEQETSDIEELRKKYTDAQGRVQTAKQELIQLSSSKKEKEGEWASIEDLGIGAQCPKCQQKLTEEHYKIVQIKYKDEIAELNSKINSAKQLQSGHETAAEQLQGRIAEKDEKLRVLQQIMLKLEGLKTQRKSLQSLNEEHGEAISEALKFKSLLEGDSFAIEKLAQIKDIDSKLSDLKPHVDRYRTIKDKIEKYEADDIERKYLESKGIADRKSEYSEHKTQLEKNKEEVNGNLSETDEELRERYKEHEEKKKVIDELVELRSMQSSLLQSQTQFETVISEATIQLKALKERFDKLEKDLNRHKANLVQADILSVVRSWLEMVFIPSLQSIEKAVLLTLNQEFNSLFQRWFRDLIEIGELNGYIDEDFTPIVEQGGYELEVESLSGGEKTSLALAYRLALNIIVKQVTDTMKSNLLILDEPTDGFSREQLFKMRDILNDVNCDQIIMVSHESELENVADHIYRVRKEGNTSTVIGPP
ncbi:MAG: hypothetical protein AMS17_17345 [Spirochaetes bacterium DG_61]|nr:MAG: hypothetical protein AMS17_17345 [Spirochaetes bacterium DG_61]